MTQKELAHAATAMIFSASIEELGDLTASEIARRLGVSLPNLSRAFRKHFNGTLVYVLRAIKYSVFELLMEKNKNLTTKKALEILDIRSHSNFCKGFKLFKGYTPGRYVESVRNSRPCPIELPWHDFFLTGESKSK